ncbi:MAG: UDP-N-acetylmuramate:L-alanyl-gamma-D-glutamyl-meso-diaminopimelate ligase [Bacteroidetes bacterium ADurb.Bin408]|nr:MAG: UDP-N-acetylmuramate:L-alanyl-gamma-D-glutamyl-meso-diaminopimelate ligase [Bacteroidetes bacterium ADurb.Bin408]
MRIHFIAIGGAAMHNLAIALHKKGYKVTGSDDEIFEPSLGRLAACGLLPHKEGWDVNQIDSSIDAVILGMHAREDNPELLKAKELGIKIFSYPEYLYEQSKNKKRVVIAGSHGKTTITAMILHVLGQCGVACDYMVGAQLEGFDVMVKLTDDAPFMIIEGDEYLTSPIDKRPKFHLYNPDIAVISGISWDHINVFPTFDNYVEQFRIFVEKITENGHLIYFNGDNILCELAKDAPAGLQVKAYNYPDYEVEEGVTFLKKDTQKIRLEIFGKHNLANIEAARNVCNLLGVGEDDFYNAIRSFKGASKRLELVYSNEKGRFYKDFAHAPSKLKATIEALRQQFPHQKLIACLELHTFSSLNEKFLPLYKDCMNDADIACVYFNPHTLAHKKLPPLTGEKIAGFFNRQELFVFDDSSKIRDFLIKKSQAYDENLNVLMMSSGNFDGIVLEQLACEMLG